MPVRPAGCENVEHDDEPPEPFGASELAEWLNRRLEEAKASYNQILNRLWVSNGAAAAATLTAGGVMTRDGQAPPGLLLIPLSLFLLGLLLLSLGAIFALVSETRAIRDMESVDSILRLKTGHFKRPSEQAGLTLSNWQTRMAVGASLALMLGVVTGFGILVSRFG